VANPQDLGEIRERLRSFLADAGLRQTCRQAALAAARRYNWEQEAPKLIDLYARL
jgi:glycosyltransferase involved in cell wall biosynthesis